LYQPAATSEIQPGSEWQAGPLLHDVKLVLVLQSMYNRSTRALCGTFFLLQLAQNTLASASCITQQLPHAA
jgi:hypothetical protein